VHPAGAATTAGQVLHAASQEGQELAPGPTSLGALRHLPGQSCGATCLSSCRVCQAQQQQQRLLQQQTVCCRQWLAGSASRGCLDTAFWTHNISGGEQVSVLLGLFKHVQHVLLASGWQL
jgi:hypothetical protein